MNHYKMCCGNLVPVDRLAHAAWQQNQWQNKNVPDSFARKVEKTVLHLERRRAGMEAKRRGLMVTGISVA